MNCRSLALVSILISVLGLPYESHLHWVRTCYFRCYFVHGAKISEMINNLILCVALHRFKVLISQNQMLRLTLCCNCADMHRHNVSLMKRESTTQLKVLKTIQDMLLFKTKISTSVLWYLTLHLILKQGNSLNRAGFIIKCNWGVQVQKKKKAQRPNTEAKMCVTY